MTAVEEYNAALDEPMRGVASVLAVRLADGLPDAGARLWHGHPVWLDGADPVAGYKAFPRWVTLLFWNGQRFDGADGLTATGASHMASVKITSPQEIEELPLDGWIQRAGQLGGWRR